MEGLSTLLLFHFIFDFIFQSKEMGQKKSKNFVFLFAHIFIIFIGIFIGGILVFGDIAPALTFSLFNAATHLVVDLVYWNIYAVLAFIRYYGFNRLVHCTREDWSNLQKNWEWHKDHLFIITIGIDQITHCIILNELYVLFLSIANVNSPL